MGRCIKRPMPAARHGRTSGLLSSCDNITTCSTNTPNCRIFLASPHAPRHISHKGIAAGLARLLVLPDGYLDSVRSIRCILRVTRIPASLVEAATDTLSLQRANDFTPYAATVFSAPATLIRAAGTPSVLTRCDFAMPTQPPSFTVA
jgi:hypothetical protein